MNIRMTAQISGMRDGQEWPAPGDLIDVPEDEAKGLIAMGMAKADEPATPAPAPTEEAATAPTASVETAVRKPRTRKA